MIPLTGIFSAITSGVPLAKEIIGLFKKNKKTNEGVLSGMQPADLINHVKALESKDDKPILTKLGNLVITLVTVYAVIYASKHFGLTYEAIINLFGLVK